MWHDCLQVQAEDRNEAISMAIAAMEDLEYFDERIDPYRLVYGIELVAGDLENESDLPIYLEN